MELNDPGGCLPNLGPAVHSAIQRRVMTAGFLTRLEGLEEAEHARLVRALAAVGLPVLGRGAPVEEPPPPDAEAPPSEEPAMQPAGDAVGDAAVVPIMPQPGDSGASAAAGLQVGRLNRHNCLPGPQLP